MNSIDWSDTIPQEGVLRWHVAWTKPGPFEEAIAERALRVRGYSPYRPIIPKTFIDRRHRLVDGSQSLFPRYLFVLPHPSGWEALRTAPGIVYGDRALLRVDGRLATISHNDPSHVGIVQIDEFVRSIWSNERKPKAEETKFKTGDQVKIKKGLWVEFCGEIEKLDDNDRAWVLFQFLGGTRHALISFDHLSPAAAIG